MLKEKIDFFAELSSFIKTLSLNDCNNALTLAGLDWSKLHNLHEDAPKENGKAKKLIEFAMCLKREAELKND